MILSLPSGYETFLEELKTRVVQSRYKAARFVNRELILLYHHIGTEILSRQKEQGWGTKIIDKLSKDLRSAFPEMKGFSLQNLKYMKRFAEEYTYTEIGQQAIDQQHSICGRGYSSMPHFLFLFLFSSSNHINASNTSRSSIISTVSLPSSKAKESARHLSFFSAQRAFLSCSLLFQSRW